MTRRMTAPRDENDGIKDLSLLDRSPLSGRVDSTTRRNQREGRETSRQDETRRRSVGRLLLVGRWQVWWID